MPCNLRQYHKKTDAELRYIQKDAYEAMRAAQALGDRRGEEKYADQINDACTVLNYRYRKNTQEVSHEAHSES